MARGNPAVGYMPQTRGSVGPAAADRLGLRGQRRSAGIAGACRCSDREARREVAWALDRVQASDLARRPLAETSGGERQRLLLAQALLGRPRLLLLDEPLISLDPHHQRAVVELTRTLQQELGITVLFSAHELNPLLGALDRVLYLGHGQAALGTVDDVITGPVLSRLYGSEIDVVRVNGRIFVMSGGHDVERDAHQHDHGAAPCSRMTSCRTRSPPPGSWRWCAGWSGSSWCCARRLSPAMRCRMSASPAPPARC